MKQIIIAGNLTRDAETRNTQNGDKVTGFSVAVNDRKGNPTFFDCSLWGKRGEALAQYLSKATPVTVIGEFGTREHEGKTYLTVNVSDVKLQGGKRDSAPAPQPASADLDGDTIPF